MVGRLSLYSTDYMRSTFVGLRNFTGALRDEHFLRSFANVFWFVLFIGPLGIGIPYWVALFLQRFSRRAQAAGRFICYVPSLSSGLVMALLWRWFLRRDGLINAFLTYAGLEAVGWLGQPWPARVAVAMAALSAGPGMFVILFSAAILAIPKELREAATIDGATERQYRRWVLRPLLMPTVLLAVLLMIVGTMQSWETIYVLFPAGGPRGSTATPVYEIFMTAFQYGRAGAAAAKGILLIGVIALIVAVKQRVERWTGAGQ